MLDAQDRRLTAGQILEENSAVWVYYISKSIPFQLLLNQKSQQVLQANDLYHNSLKTTDPPALL